jgi:hypothetical protein
MKNLPAEEATDDQLLALEGRRKILRGILDSFDGTGRKDKKKTTDVVPRNVPALQLLGDTEVVKFKMVSRQWTNSSICSN